MTDLDPSFKPLAKLIGSWQAQGRTLDATKDNIFGEVTIQPVLDGKYIELRGRMTFKDYTFESIELVYCDAQRKVFPSAAYASMGEGPGGMPAAYEWFIETDGTVVHRGAGAIYHGTFSSNDTVLAGGWRPDNEHDSRDEASYDLTMRCMQQNL